MIDKYINAMCREVSQSTAIVNFKVTRIVGPSIYNQGLFGFVATIVVL